MRSVRLLFFTVCAVHAYFFVAVCAEYVNNLLPYAQSTLIICYRLRRVRLQSIKYLAIFVLTCAYANNLLPHAQGTLTICYRMRRVRLQFVTVCAVYANEAAHMLISPFSLNQVKTYEKSQNSKKAIMAHSNEPQRILKKLFFLC